MRRRERFGYDFEMGRLKARLAIAASVFFALALWFGLAFLVIYLFSR